MAALPDIARSARRSGCNTWRWAELFEKCFDERENNADGGEKNLPSSPERSVPIGKPAVNRR
jgi:hypothetical protein